MKKSLKDRAQEFGNSLPFMSGREKADMTRLLDGTFTIRDYGFLTAEDKKTKVTKEYVCFVVDEDPQNFYFGGFVITKNMQELDAEGYHDEILKDGLPAHFSKKKGADNEYTAVKFYPEA